MEIKLIGISHNIIININIIMPIKYADITIVINSEKQTWGSFFKYWIGDEDIITENDTIIILFEDGDIVDKHEKKTEWEIGPITSRGVYPIWFSKIYSRLIRLKTPHIKNGNLALDFKPIFKDNLKFTAFNKEASVYNAIYEITGIGDVFALVKSGPKFQYVLAYHDEYFDKSDITYFIHKVFTRQ
jgi:hypothetical protein